MEAKQNESFFDRKPRAVAEQLALHLNGTGSGAPQDYGLTADELSSLSPKQQALCSEAGFLLLGQSKNLIQTGLDRVRDNLLEVVSTLDDATKASQQDVARKLTHVIEHAALFGLSVQGATIGQQSYQDRIR